MSKEIQLGKTAEGKDVAIQLDRLIESRMLVQANSGAGKSWALRRILEQSHGHVQQLVIDVEDEFHTLRERFDYVLAGRTGGDCPADVRSAPLLARRLLELQVSAIIGISELQAHDRIRFVRLFLESLISSPRDLWHPVLVVIDECHLFCPEKGHGEAESSAAVIDLMTRGRKRGFCGIPATQRISKLHKDACEVNNKLIGRSALDVDMARAAKELGFTTREQTNELRALKPGEFFAFGPAITDTVTRMTVGPVATTHPKAGQRSSVAPPPHAKVQVVLAQLADLPKQAEEEAKTAGDLRRQVQDLTRELATIKKIAPAADPGAINNAVEKAVASIKERVARELMVLEREWSHQIRGAQNAFGLAQNQLTQFSELFGSYKWPKLPSLDGIQPEPDKVLPPASRQPTPRNAEAIPRRDTGVQAEGIKGPEQRILDAIAWMESVGVTAPEQTAVAFLAGYTTGGGAYNNPRGALRSKGLIEYVGDRLSLTDAGRQIARFPDGALTAKELQRRVLERLPGPESKILQVLLGSYPKAISNQECADQAGYANGGGAYNNPRGRLRSLGLIDYVGGMLVAKPLLFLEGR